MRLLALFLAFAKCIAYRVSYVPPTATQNMVKRFNRLLPQLQLHRFRPKIGIFPFLFACLGMGFEGVFLAFQRSSSPFSREDSLSAAITCNMRTCNRGSSYRGSNRCGGPRIWGSIATARRSEPHNRPFLAMFRL